MSDYQDTRELTQLDPREAYPSEVELDALENDLLGYKHMDMAKDSEVVCILCESGYHDHAWEIRHIMQCGCPCHTLRVVAAGQGN
jgi:hypothetical protein